MNEHVYFLIKAERLAYVGITNGGPHSRLDSHRSTGHPFDRALAMPYRDAPKIEGPLIRFFSPPWNVDRGAGNGDWDAVALSTLGLDVPTDVAAREAYRVRAERSILTRGVLGTVRLAPVLRGREAREMEELMHGARVEMATAVRLLSQAPQRAVDLLDALHVSWRTLDSIMQALEAAGLPLTQEKRGREVFFALRPGWLP